MADPLLDILNGGAATPAQSANGGDPLLALIGSSTPAPPAERNLPSVQAGSAVNGWLSQIPRQLGLTARYGMEGLANTAQVATEPIRYLTDRLTGSTGTTVPLGVLASQTADAMGLPKPQDADERVIGDASRLVAGTGVLGGAASLARNAPGIAGQASQFLSANMPQQLASAAGAGLAGGASREAGGNPLEQGASALAGGVLGGLAPGAVTGAVNAARNAFTSPSDQQISLALQRAGVDWSQLPAAAQNSLRGDLADALRTGQQLDPDSVRRLADFRLTGLTPTRGMVTLDPVQITKEQNLAKMGANSADSSLQTLARIQNDNNTRLIGNLNDAGAAAGDLFTAGQQAIGAINGIDASKQATVSSLYSTARNTAGGDIPLDRQPYINSVFGALSKEGKLAFLPDSIGNMLNQISAGVVSGPNGQQFEVPFNAQTLDNLKTMIATAQRSTGDGNVKAALSIARQAIDATPLAPVKNTFGGGQLVTGAMGQAMQGADAQAGNFMDALNQARAASAQRFSWQESARPIEAALSGAQPDNFVQRFVINGSLQDAQAVANNAPSAQVKEAILSHLKAKALNGASDEVGKFSQSAYNKALDALGDRKLSLFFSPDEVQQLRAVGRVASYAQAQPAGSAVNNSNSGALLLGKGYDALKGLLNKVPGGEALVTRPLTNIEIAIKNRQAQNVVPGLLAQTPGSPLGQSLLLPGVAAGGLLAAP